MSFDLTGRRALVTGAGHGIGAGIAEALAAAGADVVVHYGRSAGPAAEVVERIGALGRKATAIGADVTVTSEVDRLVDEAVAFLGGLEILVTNAGHLIGRSPVADMSDEHFSKVVEVNLGSTFRTVRAAIPHLRAAGTKGRVVTMASLAAHNGGGAGAAVYAASKAGVVGLTKGLAKELGPAGITVNALAPGFIGGTAFHDTFTPPEAQKAMVGGIGVGRGGTVEDVAGAVVWLCSDAGAFINGTTVDIDGGVGYR
ncbi:SDR family NAD(P)-dependent oxidoreductase [Pseudonocardia cypriaca]|uniref:3-oxoacyl-[acyl-carrier protein] reductase n=1 Tax=Pseudonocardia cypriaca TaxID=882449 RepID=A0A543GGW8_9PSEU|nr:SDR family oxidoreductase [Pseudonocardia cypriaca]TQM45317.1 3-oxoacyl-[acyl-carrier protein] reductase [Pseudonocardia cypriaca]